LYHGAKAGIAEISVKARGSTSTSIFSTRSPPHVARPVFCSAFVRRPRKTRVRVDWRLFRAAAAFSALAPPAQSFTRGRDRAVWLELTPLQRSTGGKQRLGKTSKMGERTLRRLLIHRHKRYGTLGCAQGNSAGFWLERMLAHKPRMLVAVALANETARIGWALLAKGVYRASIAAT
jgi:hypothetical protein